MKGSVPVWSFFMFNFDARKAYHYATVVDFWMSNGK